MVQMPVSPSRGYLLIRVEEASGKTQKDLFTWDTSASSFEAFVKVELRGGERNIKAQTSKAPLINDTVTWRENLKLEVLEGGNELRIMLCREKYTGIPAKKGTSVIAACGIFVSDIIDAVPIDKYFELFKPNAGGEGGFIRICLNFAKDAAELDMQGNQVNLVTLSEDEAPLIASATQAATSNGTADKGSKPRTRRRLVLPLLAGLAVGGAVAGAVIKGLRRRG